MNYKKDFDTWNGLKKSIECKQGGEAYAYPREVWWCSLGVNLGVEIDGKKVGSGTANPPIDIDFLSSFFTFNQQTPCIKLLPPPGKSRSHFATIFFYFLLLGHHPLIYRFLFETPLSPKF